MGVAAVFIELLAEQQVYKSALLGGEKGALNEQVCLRRVLAAGPGGADFGELGGVQEVGLESEHSEEQVTVGGLGGYGGDPAIRNMVDVKQCH